MKKIGKALGGLLSGLLVSAAATFTTTSAHADIITVSNQILVISPPASVAPGNYSNDLVYLFPERTSYRLTNSVRADISRAGSFSNQVQLNGQMTNLAVNTRVDSYYLHHASTLSNIVASASIIFDTNVLGIVCVSSNLFNSQGQLGAPGTTYPSSVSGNQGYELGPLVINDRITLSADRRIVTVTTSASPSAQDDLRIITAARPPAQPPVANAGTNQTVNELDTVVLDGSASSDPNTPPLPLTYSWLQTGGISVTLTGADTATAMFTAPNVPPSGAVLLFQLTVSNGATPAATNSTVIVNVNSVNAPPSANAGPDQSVGESTLVTLDGSASNDPDDDMLTLQWSQVSGPTVTLSGADTVNPTFTAPDVTQAQGSVALQFQLVVNDGQVNSGAATVTITVTNINDAPLANAGSNQTVNELVPVTLNGTGSTDPDGNTLTYAWTQILGSPTVTLSGADTATPNFTSPQLNIGGTNGSITLTFQLTVSDGVAESTSTVDVRVNNVNHAPFVDAGPNQTVPAGSTVTLSGTNSSDIDGDPLAFAWTQVSGTNVTLNSADTDTANFIAPVVGPAGATLTFRLTVSDGFSSGSNDVVTIHVTYVNHAPAVSAGSPQTVNEGDTATLAGTASDADGNGLTVAWTQISGPAVTLANDTTLAPSFTAPSVTRDETNVVLRLTADDGFGGITSDDVSVHIANLNHAPVAQAPANFTVPEGTAVNLIGQGTDPDTEEQSQLIYAWTQTAGPAVTLSGAGPNASFTSPLVTDGGDPDGKVTLTFALAVTDPNGAASTNSVEVVAANVDHSPTAVAGNNLTVNEGSAVTLNGSASSDPDLDALAFTWVQTAGPAVTLLDANTAFPHFTAPFVNAAGATLQFRLTVNDGFGGTNSASTTVTVNNINDPPVCSNAQPSIAVLWPPLHNMVKVSITGVIDPNNNATIHINSVTQDEPTGLLLFQLLGLPGLGDNVLAPDAVINADGTVLLRAERAGLGNGRVYHVHFTASDFEGSSTGMVKVSVPHNKKSDPAIDAGELYDSTQ